MEIKVIDINGQETSKIIKLDDTVFFIKPNKHVVYLVIKQYLANQRQGTHKSKERSEVIGSTKKIKKQKGSGGARFGDIKSPIFRGGGRVFGPRPKDYRFKLNKSIKILAKKSLLSQKVLDKKINVIEKFEFQQIKTKRFLDLLCKLKVENKKTLFILGDKNINIYLSSRNLKNTKVVHYLELNSYDIINADQLFFLEDGLEKFQNILKK